MLLAGRLLKVESDRIEALKWKSERRRSLTNDTVANIRLEMNDGIYGELATSTYLFLLPPIRR